MLACGIVRFHNQSMVVQLSFKGELLQGPIPALTMILAWEFSWFHILTLTYGEAMKPTFGDAAEDIKMPADGFCFYHCFNYVLSNGAAELTERAAMRLRHKIVTQLRADIKPERASRLLKLGSGGYPDEEDFAGVVEVLGISFAIVQDEIRDPLVYGSDRGPVKLTMRRHFVADGEGHCSARFDILSYDTPDILSYEELTMDRLDGYSEFLQTCLRADPSIGNTALIGMLETTHAVSAKNSIINFWRGRAKARNTAVLPCASCKTNCPLDGFG